MLEFTSVLTSDDVRLNVVQTGNPHGPAIVFIHGISQSWMSWIAQLTDPLLRAKYRMVAFDLRGHGTSQGSHAAVDNKSAQSEAPTDAAHGDGQPKPADPAVAHDLHAVIAGLGLSAPTVIGWSYGGAVLQDYIAVRGGLAGIGKAVLLATSPVVLAPGHADGGADSVFSAAAIATLLKTTPFNPYTGELNSHADIAAGLTGFVELCYQDELSRTAPDAAQVQGVTGFNLFTPAAMRLAIIGRVFDHRPMLAVLSASDKARIRIVSPQGDKVLQPTRIDQYWSETGLALDTVDGEGHLFHYRNAAEFNSRLPSWLA
jgi:non-heme chloroperoxidase